MSAPEAPLVVADSLDALRPGWPELAERTGNVFATWEWLSTWWRHFGRNGQLIAGRVEADDGGPAVILPVYRSRLGALTVLRFLGHGPSDRLGPIYAPGARATAAVALRRLLADSKWQLFVGDQLPADEHWERQVDGRVLETAGNPLLRLDGLTWPDFLASVSKNLRDQIGRFERRLARDHELTYRLTEDPVRLQDDLDLLFALHGRRWSGERSSFGGPNEAFHRDFAVLALERGWLRLWFLELDGRPVAAWYGLRYAGTDSYYQAGRDPEFDRQSVGFVLLMHSLREAMADGMSEYRFLRGGEPFKYRFATDDAGLATIAVGRGAVGAAALAVAQRLRRRAGAAAPTRA